jgi:hypothetical protein
MVLLVMYSSTYTISNIEDVETKVTSFDYFKPNKNLNIIENVCPSLLEWAEYILRPVMEPGYKGDQ